MIDKHKFGAVVKAWRISQGMTQKDLRKLVRVSQGSFCDIEKGKSLPSAHTIANFLMFTDFPILDEFVRCQSG